MKKRIVLVIGVVILMMTSLVVESCSSDDGNSELPDVPPEPTIPEEKPFVGVTYLEDSLQIQLQLLNSDSIAVDTFKEGEDFIFKLTITNIGNDIVLTTPIEKICDNFFNVYSSDGTDMGKPWDQRLTNLRQSFLIPGTVWEYVCSWLEEPDEDMKSICSWIEEPVGGVEDLVGLEKYWQMTLGKRPVAFLRKERRQPLLKGSYYTQFDINIIEGKTTTIRMNFNIE